MMDGALLPSERSANCTSLRRDAMVLLVVLMLVESDAADARASICCGFVGRTGC
jgi:hypothetical protein